MKKLFLTLGSALASLVLVSSLMTTTTSCKKDEVTPTTTTTGTTTSFSFVASLSGDNITIYSNVSENTSVTGSFFNFTTGKVYTSAGASVAGSNFRIVDTGVASAPGLNFANSSEKDSKVTSDKTYFATVSGTTFTAAQVDALTDPTAESVAIPTIGFYVFKTASGLKGILEVTAIYADPAPARIGARTERDTQYLVFSYKIIAQN